MSQDPQTDTTDQTTGEARGQNTLHHLLTNLTIILAVLWIFGTALVFCIRFSRLLYTGE